MQHDDAVQVAPAPSEGAVRHDAEVVGPSVARVPPIQQTLESLLVAAGLSLFPLIVLAVAQDRGLSVTDQPQFFIYVMGGCIFTIVVQIVVFHWSASPIKATMIKDNIRLTRMGKFVFWGLGLAYVYMISFCVKHTGGTSTSLFSVFYPVLVAITLIGSLHVRHGFGMAIVCAFAAWNVLEVPMSKELEDITRAPQYVKAYYWMFVYALFMAVVADYWRGRLTDSRREYGPG